MRPWIETNLKQFSLWAFLFGSPDGPCDSNQFESDFCHLQTERLSIVPPVLEMFTD